MAAYVFVEPSFVTVNVSTEPAPSSAGKRVPAESRPRFSNGLPLASTATSVLVPSFGVCRSDMGLRNMLPLE